MLKLLTTAAIKSAAQERRLQASKREEAARQAAAPAPNPDREPLMQLAAELSKLRQLQTEQDKRPSPAVAPVAVPEALSPVPVMANRKALVIGNDRYKFVSPLNTAKEDAKSIADGLKAVGYQVSLKLDVSEKEFKSTLRQFRSQVEAGDEVASSTLAMAFNSTTITWCQSMWPGSLRINCATRPLRCSAFWTT